MRYEKMQVLEFFAKIDTEEKARRWFWRCRFEGEQFVCPHCGGPRYWQHHGRPEVRECVRCERQVPLRAGTLLEHSKLPVLVWLRAIALVTQGKRGISAMELQRQLGLRSYGTCWNMLHKIRHAFGARDQCYTLRGVVELDGATFGRSHSDNASPVLIAIETKSWVDERGRPKARAGFAKVALGEETSAEAQTFVDQGIEPQSMVNTDGSPSLRNLDHVHADYQVTGQDPDVLDHWLPWVHRFISNAKTWLLGTHHGVRKKHLHRYLAEYAYRFNRRHDMPGLLHRAVTACAIATPITQQALFG